MTNGIAVRSISRIVKKLKQGIWAAFYHRCSTTMCQRRVITYFNYNTITSQSYVTGHTPPKAVAEIMMPMLEA
jgi:hypothetical protein